MQRTMSVAFFGCYDRGLSAFGSEDWKWARWAEKPYGAYALYSRPTQYHRGFEKTVSLEITSLKSGSVVLCQALLVLKI